MNKNVRLWKIKNKNYMRCDFHSGENINVGLLHCNAMWIHMETPTFLQNESIFPVKGMYNKYTTTG
jgi:hypothetical protein